MCPPKPVAQSTTAHSQPPLDDQELFVDEAPPRRLSGFHRIGEMEVVQRLGDFRKRALLAQLRRQDFGHVPRVAIDRLADERTELIGAQVLRQRVDRDDADWAFVLCALSFVLCPLSLGSVVPGGDEGQGTRDKGLTRGFVICQWSW